jgi:hypothetical protein
VNIWRIELSVARPSMLSLSAPSYAVKTLVGKSDKKREALQSYHVCSVMEDIRS